MNCGFDQSEFKNIKQDEQTNQISYQEKRNYMKSKNKMGHEIFVLPEKQGV